MLKIQLHWQILIAILAALFIGWIFNGSDSALANGVAATCAFFGSMFLNALKMVVIPLVLASIICAVTSLGGRSDLGRLGGKTLGFYMLSSFLAILVGLFFVNFFTPGIIDGSPAKDLLDLSSSDEVTQALKKVENRGSGDLAAVFLRMVPPNIVKAAADGQMLGLIVFGILFGSFMVQIANPGRDTLKSMWQGILDTMMRITMFIMKFAPLGVFALICKTVIATGFDSLRPMLLFMFTVSLALAAHVFITMPILLKVLGGINPIKHIKAMSPALLCAFSTASSSGTLPLTMECVEKNAGVSNKTSGFVLPLGATINMDGTALYECVAAMFIAQAYGLELGFATQFLIVITALLTSVGVAGIPAASLVAITVILAAIGLPAEGIALLLLTDRVLDMFRTAVNVFSDSCCAAIIARSEGEETKVV
ncbi:MAG: proton glutamate symport protein [Flavobacteriales bacterium]|jgi:proton glutamate symport protein